MEIIKIIVDAKAENAVDNCTLTKWIQKCFSVCKNCKDRDMSEQLKTEDSEVVLQNLVISGEYRT